MSLVNQETATVDITSWLDKKKVFQSTRNSEIGKNSIDLLVEAVSEGILVLNPDTFELTYTLLNPLESSENKMTVTSMTFKSRLNDAMLRTKLVGIKSDDSDGRLNAMIAALTDAPRGVIDKIDSVDKKVINAIVIFFI